MSNKTKTLPRSLHGLNAVEQSNIYGFLYTHGIFQKFDFLTFVTASFSVLMHRAWRLKNCHLILLLGREEQMFAVKRNQQIYLGRKI